MLYNLRFFDILKQDYIYGVSFYVILILIISIMVIRGNLVISLTKWFDFQDTVVMFFNTGVTPDSPIRESN